MNATSPNRKSAIHGAAADQQPVSAARVVPRIELNDSAITLLPEPTTPCRVLLVDDDELVVRRISSLLQGAGYETHTARTGEEALRLLETTMCQIVLTDWRMPDMDGIALCRNLRRRQGSSYIYILMLTVRDGTNDLLAGLAAGADDYLVKGAPPDEILARLGVGRRITHLERSLRTSNLENQRISVTDALTGARNRRFLMKYLPRELARSKRYSHPLSIISCDLDNFKRINDGFGHTSGDEILQSFVTRAENCFRSGIDWIARSGGEEFVIVLPETNLKAAGRAAERLRETIAAHPISTSSGPLEVTVSMGVTALETSSDLESVSCAEFLRAADRRLYTSKSLGRNRATVAPIGCADTSFDVMPGGRRDTH
jgi:two-component system cell cycle response regulator